MTKAAGGVSYYIYWSKWMSLETGYRWSMKGFKNKQLNNIFQIEVIKVTDIMLCMTLFFVAVGVLMIFSHFAKPSERGGRNTGKGPSRPPK